MSLVPSRRSRSMSRSRTLFVVLGLLGVAAIVRAAFETGATIRSVNVENRTLTVFAGGQQRVVRVAPNVRVLDREGKELPDGLRSKELKEGAEVTITVEREGSEPVIQAIRLG